MQNVELRRRVWICLNEGEGKHSLARAGFPSRLGEIRDRSFESRRNRTSDLKLVVIRFSLLTSGAHAG